MAKHPTTPPTCQPLADATDTATKFFGHPILVGTPVTYWIPIFALGAEKGRDEVESTMLTSLRSLKRAVGANAASALRSDRYGVFELVYVRRRTTPRIASHSTWLYFVEVEHAKAFVTDYPDVGQDAVR